MASIAAPPGLGNAAENAPTQFPHSTSARKHADLRPAPAGTIKKIAGADNKIAIADEKMEVAGAKMEIGGANLAIPGAVIADSVRESKCPAAKLAGSGVPTARRQPDATGVAASGRRIQYRVGVAPRA